MNYLLINYNIIMYILQVNLIINTYMNSIKMIILEHFFTRRSIKLIHNN